LDVAASSFLLAICGIPMVLVALLIWLGSGAPILFRQERRGLRGHGFKVLKFRTMIQHAEQRTGPVLATREDPRVTPLGRALRATRLDELPQLWNVLRGEMSLVGPRPEREFFARRFDLEFPEYPLRTSVKPGLTGLAQVCGGYSSSAESKLRLDLMYIANYSLSLDLSILLQTIRVVLQRSPALGVEPESPVNFGYEASMRREGQHGA
jgi:lipopolysaccharide/colanic/teichoic acid biosynthesis glycosyltransferase